MVEVLEVSKSGYYKWKKRLGKQDPEETALMELIVSIYIEHRGRYGYRRITKQIQRMGISINGKHVLRIMRNLKLKGKSPGRRKKTTNSEHKEPVSENLVQQDFTTEREQKIWLSDITYIKTSEGWLYLSVVMDLYSRRILGWELSESLTKESVINAFKKAAETYRITADKIFHSDRGVQFASGEFREILQKYGFQQSMSGRGNCYDNAPMESFFHTLKNELLIKNAVELKYKVRGAIFEYIEYYYNRRRLHSSLKYRTPNEVFFDKQIH
jgi:transposase InsO family protein